MKVHVETTHNGTAIHQRVFITRPDADGAEYPILSQIYTLQDEGVRQALIAMGWTPPTTIDHSAGQ